MLFGSSQQPLRVIEFPVNPQSRTLLVMIHGTGDRPESFAAHDFVRELVARGADVDAVAVQSRLTYYVANQIDERIHEDVVIPARMRGVERIFLLGISSGGLGALEYAQNHPEQVDGLILFAPFLGPGLFLREIEAQGGLREWRPNAPFEEVEYTWLFLAGYARGRSDPPIDLMFGDRDKFLRSLRMAAGVLPAGSVHVVDGKHDWTAWLRLWRDHLDRDPFGLITSPG
jgi:pimeloyl-ACP methyl ester carboxylesterase